MRSSALVLLIRQPLIAVQVKKDFQEAVLSYRQDEFFHKNMYANFGDIGSAVKELVDDFQKQTTNTKRINTIEDMQVSLQLQNISAKVLNMWHFLHFSLCGCPWRHECDFSDLCLVYQIESHWFM